MANKPQRTPSGRPRPVRADQVQAAALGFALGVLAWQASLQLGLAAFPLFRVLEGFRLAMLAFGVAGVILALTPLRRFFALLLLFPGLALVFIASTPVVMPAVRGLVRKDPLQKADAIYVLGSGIFLNGELPNGSQMRMLHGFELLGQGYAPRLVICRLAPPAPSALSEVQRQLKALRLAFPVTETTPCGNTHDEAVAIAAMAKHEGWKKVILVTQPAHTRRAVATFRKAGVRVISSPCIEGSYDFWTLESGNGRITAFRDWLREVIGYETYKRRGWI
jgi:uncharacterized SAM-binding protein YcdF (DUF218 family)